MITVYKLMVKAHGVTKHLDLSKILVIKHRLFQGQNGIMNVMRS